MVLTPQEKKIKDLRSTGMSLSEIAEMLKITRKDVELGLAKRDVVEDVEVEEEVEEAPVEEAVEDEPAVEDSGANELPDEDVPEDEEETLTNG